MTKRWRQKNKSRFDDRSVPGISRTIMSCVTRDPISARRKNQIPGLPWNGEGLNLTQRRKAAKARRKALCHGSYRSERRKQTKGGLEKKNQITPDRGR